MCINAEEGVKAKDQKKNPQLQCFVTVSSQDAAHVIFDQEWLWRKHGEKNDETWTCFVLEDIRPNQLG